MDKWDKWDKWDKRYLSIAAEISTWSKDPRKQVGAVIVGKRYIEGTGFNGLPSSIPDTPEILNNREIKNKLVVHAEVNALLASEGKGKAIYIWPCLPCTQCLGLIIQSGIKKVVTGPLDDNSSWDQDLVIEIAKRAKVTIKIVEEL